MSSSTPSPISDGSSSEGSALRAFVDDAIAKDREAGMSPRSAILSHTSLKTGSKSDKHSGPGVMDNGAQIRRRAAKGTSRRQRSLDVARPSTLSQLVDVDISRKDPREEVMRLRELLKTVEKQAVSEARRAEELERANLEAMHRVQLLSENRLLAEQEAEKANQEKRLYQLQLDNAQKEIERSQEAVKQTERERDDAEAAAARARAKTRKLHEQQMVLLAREEGRRLGYEAGLQHAEAELKMIAAKKAAKDKRAKKEGRRDDKGKERERPRETKMERRKQVEPPKPIRDDIIPSPDSPEMSPSQLPLRGLPPLNMPPRPPSTQGGPSASRFYRAPTEALDNKFSVQSMPQPLPVQPPFQSQNQSQPPSQLNRQSLMPNPQARQQEFVAASPNVIHWELDVPSPEQLTHHSNGSWGRSSNEAIPQLPREQWVSADNFQRMNPNVPNFPGGQPPQFLLPPRSAPMNTGIPTNNNTPTKAVKFPLFSRPSLVKTSQKAASWYRSLSQRKKNRPLIDPIPEESVPQTGTATTTQPRTATTTNYETESMSATAESAGGMYNRNPEQSAPSWRQGGQSAAPSVRTHDYAYSKRARPTSDMMSVSTKISQFDLLSTPYIAAQSVKSGREGDRRVREMDSYLSVIKEDPSSRDNTPSSNRYRTSDHTNMSPIPQPNFAPALHNRTSAATMNSSATNKRRPPVIAVPEPDEVLEPFGVAYDRHARTNGSNNSLGLHSRQPAQAGADLSRRPSRISERTTPDTSIVIDVVPPSGFAPDVVKSPPHTGRNHLSPYHTYQPTPQAAGPRIVPTQSMASLRTQGGTRLDAPSALLGALQRPETPAETHKTPSQSLKEEYMREHGSNYAPSPRVQRPPSSISHAPSNRDMMSQTHKSARSLQLHTPRPEPTYTPRRPAESIRPESVRSPASRNNNSPYPNNNSNTYLNPAMSQASLASNQAPPNMSSGGLVLQPPIRRERSNASLRSNGSFSRFIPDEYQDPAFWGPNGPSDPPVQSSNSIRGGNQSRPPSVNSGLSYV